MWSAIAAAVAPQLVSGAFNALGASKQLSQRDAMQAQSAFNLATQKQSLLKGPSWEMAGLKAAGINPYFRYGSGGQSLPTAQGVSQAPSINRLEGAAGAIGNAVNSGLEAWRTGADVERQNAETKRTIADLERIAADIQRTVAETGRIKADEQLAWTRRESEWFNQALTRVQTDEARARIDETYARVRNLDVITRVNLWEESLAETRAYMARLGIPYAENNAAFFSEWWGRYTQKIDNVGRALNPFSDATTPNYSIGRGGTINP